MSTDDFRARLEKQLAIHLLRMEEVKDIPEICSVWRGDANGIAIALREFDLFGYAQVKFDLEWARIKVSEHAEVEVEWDI